jgi:ATP-dependent phosphofructokinase / diphosphate-dependent phosphofructokinase
MANLFFAHSGGVTCVVNAIASSVIKYARLNTSIDKVYVGKNGILGAINGDLYDSNSLTDQSLARLTQTPASAFGSCRYKLSHPDDSFVDYEKLIATFKQYNIRYFLYNGGNDSQDTTNKIQQACRARGYEIQCIGIPKTIDNDLAMTDCCPGYGSTAKYVAISTLEASLDIASMCATSTKAFILEVMGRHTGWIAAAASLIKHDPSDPPHIILIPERAFEQERFIKQVKHSIDQNGYCVIVAAEGIKNAQGSFISSQNSTDSFGHAQLGGVAQYLSSLLTTDLGIKTHYAIADYLQRSAAHIMSKTDLDQAIALGKAAIDACSSNASGVMMSIKRISDLPYQWNIEHVPLDKVANIERKLPKSFIDADGSINNAFKAYASPLIQGEAYPSYHNGLPIYFDLKNIEQVVDG